MEVFLTIRRKKTTIFFDCKEETTIIELKRRLSYLVDQKPENQSLIYNGVHMENLRQVQYYGLTKITTKPHSPAIIGLVFRRTDGTFEELEITPYSEPIGSGVAPNL